MRAAIRAIILVTACLVVWRLAIDFASFLEAKHIERVRERMEMIESRRDHRPDISHCFPADDLWGCIREKDNSDSGSDRSDRLADHEMGNLDRNEDREAEIRKDI